MQLTTTISDISADQSAVYALLGYGVVFFGIILLMLVVVVLGKLFAAAQRQKAEAPVQAPVQAPALPVTPAVAPGAAGQLKLYNVDPKTAAILMAITANKMGKPINELRFVSVREVSQ